MKCDSNPGYRGAPSFAIEQKRKRRQIRRFILAQFSGEVDLGSFLGLKKKLY